MGRPGGSLGIGQPSAPPERQGLYAITLATKMLRSGGPCTGADGTGMKGKPIHQPLSTRSTNSVPRGRGVRGAARGLERELRASGRHQKKHNSNNRSLRPRTSDSSDGHQINMIAPRHSTSDSSI
jgi:hypothetical protein